MIDSKRKAILFLTIAFVLAIIASGVILVQINEAKAQLGETVMVAAAASTIGSYHEINESDIKWVELPKSSAYESFITDEEQIEDAIAVVELREGELLTRSIVRKKLNIPDNERVVWLNPTENVLIDQQVAEGDRVDIIVSYEVGDGVETKRLLSGVSVVQVEEGKEMGPVVKISLPIEDAEQLIHYQNLAKQVRVLRVNQASD